MKNKKILIYMILISIIAVATVTFFVKYEKEHRPFELYDKNIPANVKTIESSQSSNFRYKAEITINEIIPSEPQYTSLRHIITIEPKNDKTFKDVVVTIFLNQNIKSYLFPGGSLIFGTDKNNKLSIDNVNTKGIRCGYTSWLDNNNTNDEIENLVKDITVMVKWGKNNVEVVKVSDNSIVVERYSKPTRDYKMEY